MPSWFPFGKNDPGGRRNTIGMSSWGWAWDLVCGARRFPIDSDGCRLDIVALFLLAMTFESFIAAHVQAITSSKLCMLPRLMPAPHLLLQPRRPTNLPTYMAWVTDVHKGLTTKGIGFFANIIHPLDTMPPWGFQVLRISRTRPGVADKPQGGALNYCLIHKASVLGCLMSFGLVAAGFAWGDYTAAVAVILMSFSSAILGYAASWTSKIATIRGRDPEKDIVIRTLRGAFILIKCDREVAYELYSGVEEYSYLVKGLPLRICMNAVAVVLIMSSVILLGNCSFNMQALVGATYVLLNIVYWAIGLFPPRASWDMSRYNVEDITPDDSKDAHCGSRGWERSANGTDPEEEPSFVRTLWYVIRETKNANWVRPNGAALPGVVWEFWLEEAGRAAGADRGWRAVWTMSDLFAQQEEEAAHERKRKKEEQEAREKEEQEAKVARQRKPEAGAARQKKAGKRCAGKI